MLFSRSCLKFRSLRKLLIFSTSFFFFVISVTSISVEIGMSCHTSHEPIVHRLKQTDLRKR